MSNPRRPQTVEEYIAAAPNKALPYLRKLRKILQSVAPDAQEVIKWNMPFFVEPRFLFSYSAFKSHLNFSPHHASLEVFHNELKNYKTTKYSLQIPYNEPLMEDLIRRIAQFCVEHVSQSKDKSFW
ncbi:MAG: DUF1801 domain-containing protein [Bacteroidetes bacterium]|nr:DUF1801 domain-containing protein [Bacteroidota bacterium]MCY4204103.1 DUF1801 domain-containing protein [Bacteroidota bacterium]